MGSKGWLKKVGAASPSGMVLILLGAFTWLIGWIPILGLPFKALYFIAVKIIARPTWKEMLSAIIISEIPIVNLFPISLYKLFF